MPKNKSKNKTRRTITRKTHSSLSTVRFSHPLIIIALALITLLAAANIQTTQNFTASSQSVLGEDEQSEEQKQAEEAAKESTKQVEEAQKEDAKQAEEQQKQQQEQEQQRETTTTNTTETSGSPRKSIKSKIETVSPSGLKMKTQSEGDKQETEIETTDGQKIKTKIEDDGTTKIEIENGTIKLKYSIENGQVVLKAENEDGDAVEIEDDELAELENDVEDELGDDDIKLVPTTDNQLALTQNQIAAVTNFPLSINVETKELIITTPAGQKIVTVLPDQAVQNLLATGIINRIETSSADTDTQEQLGALTGVVKLDIRNNDVVYKINGVKTQLLLGLIPVDMQTTAFVSTDDGTVVAQQRSLLANVVDFLSP